MAHLADFSSWGSHVSSPWTTAWWSVLKYIAERRSGSRGTAKSAATPTRAPRRSARHARGVHTALRGEPSPRTPPRCYQSLDGPPPVGRAPPYAQPIARTSRCGRSAVNWRHDGASCELVGTAWWLRASAHPSAMAPRIGGAETLRELRGQEDYDGGRLPSSHGARAPFFVPPEARPSR